jgi:hypothetical protein
MPTGDPNIPNRSSSDPYPLVYVRALAEHRWSEFCLAVRTPIENRIKALAWAYFLDDPRAPLPTKGTTPPEPTGRGSAYDTRWQAFADLLARYPAAQRDVICEIGEHARGHVWRGMVEGAMLDAARVDAETFTLFRATRGRPSAAERVFAYLEQHAQLLEFRSPYGEQARPDAQTLAQWPDAETDRYQPDPPGGVPGLDPAMVHRAIGVCRALVAGLPFVVDPQAFPAARRGKKNDGRQSARYRGPRKGPRGPRLRAEARTKALASLLTVPGVRAADHDTLFDIWSLATPIGTGVTRPDHRPHRESAGPRRP